MEDFDILAKSWNKISSEAAINNRNIFSTKNTSVMESILNYERNEKEEKRKQIYLMLFSLSIFIMLFAFWIGVEKFEITKFNLIGAVLLLIAFGISVITNKTDDFPDARLMNTKKYLLDLKENVSARRKRHIAFSYISVAIVFPGLYLLLHDVPFQYEIEFINMNYIVLISAVAGFVGGMIAWRKKYDAVTKPLIVEIDSLLKEM